MPFRPKASGSPSVSPRELSVRPDPSDLRGDEPSIGRVGASIAWSIAEGLGRNKLAACFSLAALLVFLPLAVGIRYDERPRYRQVILPEFERLEARYDAALDRAENGPTELRRLYHFLSAHREAVEVLQYLRSRRPTTAAGMQAHDGLIRYYELIDEHFAILRTETSLRPEIDFMARWQEVQADLAPLYDRWVVWIEGDLTVR